MSDQMNLLNVQQAHKTKDDCYTPKSLFDALGLVFDLDVACPPEGPINCPAKSWYTAADDGLAQNWYGRVWMNPPYSKPAPWVAKFVDHSNGICLVPSSKAKWWKMLWESEARAVYLGSVMFVRPGQRPFDIGYPIYLWAIGQENIEATEKIGRSR
jgi:hypothetical protein